jgi:hypothetical protein
MPQDHQRKHAQLHNVVDQEELVSITNDKGESAKYKLDHKDKQVFIAGGPEEDCTWKKTNGSYDDIVRRLGRAPATPSISSNLPVDSVDSDL